MSKKRTLVKLDWTPAQYAQIQPLLDAVMHAQLNDRPAAILAQAYSDGVVCTVVTGEEMHGVQAVLKPTDPWPGCASAEERMAKHRGKRGA